MNPEQISSSLEAGVLTLTLNRPDKLNAYTAQMNRELQDAFRYADQDDAVRVILVTGAGRGFCAGADVSNGPGSFDAASPDGGNLFRSREAHTARPAGGVVGAIFNCRKPSIAAINGAAAGIGVTITLPMDIRIASSTARFGFVFTRRGLVPEVGSAWFLPRIVGLSRAMAWCLSGRVFGADEALSGGLVSEVVPPEELLPRARALAREIVEETSAISVALTRQMLWRMSCAPLPFEVAEIDNELTKQLGASAEVKEGVAAFLEKRKPRFPGRVSRDMPAAYPWWREPF
jgi:enoyl-CoA hydratase/carnithine racemase